MLERTARGRMGARLDAQQLPRAREIVRGGRPTLLTYRDAGDAERAAMERLGIRATLICPLIVEKRALGGLVVSFEREQFGLSADDLTFAGQIAAHCAVALDRARLLDAERRARKRLAAIQEVTAALVAVRSEREVIAVMMDRAVAASGAAAGTFFMPAADGSLACVATSGSSTRVPAEWMTLSADLDVPVTNAFRTRTPVFVSSREELAALYPLLEARMGSVPTQSWAGVPLVVDEHCIGVLELGTGAAPVLMTQTRRKTVPDCRSSSGQPSSPS